MSVLNIYRASKEGNLQHIQHLVRNRVSVNDKDAAGTTPLSYASRSGHEPAVLYLLKAKADYNIMCPTADGLENLPPLSFAATFGHTAVVTCLLNHGAAVNLQSKKDHTALWIAASRGHLDTVTCLVDHGADVNLANFRKRTPLWIAASEGHPDTVAHLAEAGADVNTADVDQWTPLAAASFNGYLDTVTFLVKHGAISDVTCPHVNDSPYPLTISAQKGHTSVVSCLLEHGAKVNVQSEKNETALFAAARKGHLDTVRCLTKNGADMNLANFQNRTPVWIAASEGHINIVSHLAEAGADVNTVDVNSYTPLVVACQKNNIQMAELLIKHGADSNIQLSPDTNSMCLLSAAAIKGDTAVVSCLLKHGADVNLRSMTNHTALWGAASQAHLDTVTCLISHGADVQLPNYKKETPLWIAAVEGHTNIVSHLAEAGADVNAADEDQWTPLAIASSGGHLDIVSYLCEHGANIDLPLLDGCTPLYLACKKNHTEIVEYLIKHGANIDICDPALGESALHVSAKYGHKALTALLLAHTPPITSDKKGNTPLMLARGELESKTQKESDGGEQIKQELSEIIEMLENYVKEKCEFIPQPFPKEKVENGKDHKNRVEEEKTESCIIAKDILRSSFIENIARNILKKDERKAEIEKEVPKLFQGKEANDYLQQIWREVSNVDREITKPKSSEEALSDKQLLKLAREMKQDWKMIGGFLDFEFSQINELLTKHEGDSVYAAWAMLVSWKNNTTGSVEEKIQQLKTVLRDLDREDIVDLMLQGRY